MKRDIKEMIGMAISFGIIIAMALLLVGCSIPKNPKLSFGKKCIDKQENVVYSYIWLYNKNDGLQADKETCNLIKD